MNEKLLAAKLTEYQPEDPLVLDLAMAEILQQVVLSSLSRAGLFRVAMFHGLIV